MVYQTYTPPTCTLEVIAKGSPVLGKLGKARRQEFVLNLDDPRLPEEQHFTIKGDRSQLEALYEAVNSYVRDFLKYSLPEKDKQFPIPNSQFPIPNSQSEIYLQPRDLLTHELFLGTLATEKTGPAIALSVLHLFDLLVALEESQRDLIALPLAAEPEPTPEWLRSLALILMTAGLTVLGIRLYDRYILANQEESNLATDSKLDNLLSPLPTEVTPSVSPSPSPTVSPSPLALPTPPAPGELPTVKPSPIDVPVLFPSPVPRPSSPSFSFPPPTPRPNAATPGGSGTNVVILPQIPPPVPPPVPPQRPIFPGPALPDTSVPLGPRPPVPAAPNIYPPAIPPGGYPRNVPQRSRRGVKPYVDVTRIPLNLPSDIALPALDDTNVALIPQGRQTEEPDESVKSDLTLFDKIPQVAEVRKHFEGTWEPPEDLNKNLQYNLLLNRDGSIKKVIPIGQASVDFYELTNMPFEEEPFVSGLEEGETATVRLVLRKNGKVQTFLESVR
jgi:hypothetical protein